MLGRGCRSQVGSAAPATPASFGDLACGARHFKAESHKPMVGKCEVWVANALLVWRACPTVRPEGVDEFSYVCGRLNCRRLGMKQSTVLWPWVRVGTGCGVVCMPPWWPEERMVSDRWIPVMERESTSMHMCNPPAWSRGEDTALPPRVRPPPSTVHHPRPDHIARYTRPGRATVAGGALLL